MNAALSIRELTGLFDSICDETAQIPKDVHDNNKYHRDSLAASNIKNRQDLSPTGFGAEIAKHLRHIPVNPHNNFSSELIAKSYVFNSDRCRSEDEEILNANDFSLFKFMSEVISSARTERLYSVDPQGAQSTTNSLFDNCVHVIHGERGVGKTFFLNYALVRCNEILDKRKVIWVRLNFVYTTGFEDNLERWMHAQAAKIVFRYYDKKSAYHGKRAVSAADYLFKWIADHPRFNEAERTTKRVALRSMEQVFGQGASDEAIRFRLCDEELCRALYTFMRIEGWSFIFILDGFDQLDINPEQVSRFDEIRSSVERFISMRAAFGAAIVVVTRSNTFDDLKSYDPFKGIPEGRKYRIADVDFHQVVQRRFDAIKQVVIRRIPPHRRQTADRLETAIQNFIDSVLTPTALITESERFNFGNLRAKLQTLYLMFLNFVDETTGKGYLILEHMLLNGMRYPAVAYQYDFTEGGELVAKSDELTHEARFLPLITRVPLSRDRNSTWPSVPCSHLLLGIRTLQLCEAAIDLLGDQELLSVGELSSILTAAFSYTPALQLAAIQEMSAFDLLRMIRSERLPANSASNRLGALPKSNYLLTECLHNVAYLNLCAMRTALPPHLYNSPFVQQAYLGVGEHNARAWIDNKIANAITLYSLMAFQNRLEKKQLQAKAIDSLPARQRAVWNRAIANGLWDIIPNARSKLAVEIMQILTSGPSGWLNSETQEQIAERVRAIFRHWRQLTKPDSALF